MDCFISHEHHGRGFGLCRGVAQQRQEILPTAWREVSWNSSIMKCSSKCPLSRDERRVVAGDEPRQHVVYFGDVNDVLSFDTSATLACKSPSSAKVAVVLFEQGGTVDKPDVGVVMASASSASSSVSCRCYRFNLCLLGDLAVHHRPLAMVSVTRLP